ncbi:MAG: preprotein translocase subunit SecA [Hyphomicrobiaceae bacterium]|nr:preprotein translocase subunit SecA [Hyphomicrobiaceae bacterium]
MVSFGTIAKKIFGDPNLKALKTYDGSVEDINALEGEFEKLSDADLQHKTVEFRERLAKGETLDDLLFEAFATVREAAKRTLGQRHYDVQLIGALVLNDGKISEMKTGEGKTLVATLAVYLNALPAKGVHVVTVNDYLAKRDAEWMGKVYKFLGLSVGVIIHGVEDEDRKEQYACDVTYGTNNEFGFDYLRDNMKYEIEEMVQRGHYYAIVDEVDSILIDEARTPLIISGPTEDLTELYETIDKIMVELLKESEAATYYDLDEKQKTATFTEEGNERLEQVLVEADQLKGESLYDIENVMVVHHVNQALKAHKLFEKDKDYIVKGTEVVIIDEFTGRMMEGRRYSEGLHQALEAKEGAKIQPENQTLASITFQNYFRLYKKLSGMTGTALTEADEFADIYGLGVLEIPTNVDISRLDEDDEVYRTAEEKYAAIVERIIDCQERKQPILVGTASIEKSETISALLEDKKFLKSIGVDKTIKHKVLNARYHETEASIISQAGAPGAVTIATNMAGRGTDIQLGGNLDMQLFDWVEQQKKKKGGEPSQKEIDKKEMELEEAIKVGRETVLEAGGLFVLGTERHESRRIDNQLRGRSGRQGDPGHSKFYLSLQDDLMRIFGGDRMDSMLTKLGLEDGEAITHPWINKALEKAQSKVEARNFDIRKNLLKYDDVMNDQRKVIFEHRIELMEEEDVSETIADMRHDVADHLVSVHIPEKAFAEQWDIEGLQTRVREIFNIDLPIADWADEEGIADDEIHERLKREVNAAAAKKAVEFGPERMRQVEKWFLLQTLDNLWREHLVTLDHLRQVIGLRGYGQRDPLNEYKTETFMLFEALLTQLREDVTVQMFHVEPMSEDEIRAMEEGREDPEMEMHHMDLSLGYDAAEFDDDVVDADYGDAANPQAGAPQRPKLNRPKGVDIDPKDDSTWGKVPRNAPCPCGSGKKYKHCHGRLS